MPGAGELTERVRFERRALDARGQRTGDFSAEGGVTVYAKIIWPRGGEGISQARVQGRQPAVFTVRNSAATRAIDNSWRAVHLNTGRAYNIQSNEPQPRRDFIDLLALYDGSSGGG